MCTPDNVPQDDYGEPDYHGIDCPGGDLGDGDPTQEQLVDGASEVARGQYATTAQTCPNGPSPEQVTDVVVDVMLIAATEPVIGGTATSTWYGTQSWTYNIDTGAFAWTTDFCAGRDVGE